MDDIEIVKIAVKNINKPRSVEVPTSMITDNPYDLVNDPSIDVVVECMGGIEPARKYALEALEHGKHFVTSNKKITQNSLMIPGYILLILKTEFYCL